MRGYGESVEGRWWAPGESNPAPTDYESAALTKHELEAPAFSERKREVRNYYIKPVVLTSCCSALVVSSAERAESV